MSKSTHDDIYIRFPEHAPEGKHSEWLKFIFKCNENKPAVFGKPSAIEDWGPSGEVEEYRHVRVIFVGDDTVRIVSKTKRGVEVLKKAADDLGIRYSPVFQDIPA